MYDLSVSWACREWEQLGITACKSLFKYLLCHLAVGWILDFFDFVLYLKKKMELINVLAPVAYGGSQARDPVGAVTASLHHSSRQRQILNSLRRARD